MLQLSIRSLFHDRLYQAISSRAIFDILLIHMHVVGSHLFIVMRKTGAVPRAHCIDITHIGLEIQELAGLLYIHPIPCLVFI